ESGRRARSTLRSSGETPHTKLTAGSQAPRQRFGVTGDARIIALFTRSGASAKRTDELTGKFHDVAREEALDATFMRPARREADKGTRSDSEARRGSPPLCAAADRAKRKPSSWSSIRASRV